MLVADHVRGKLREAVAGAISLRDLDLWVSNANWSAHQSASPEARELLDDAQLRLIEFFNSDAKQDFAVLRSDLATLANNRVVTYSDTPQSVRRQASSKTGLSVVEWILGGISTNAQHVKQSWLQVSDPVAA